MNDPQNLGLGELGQRVQAMSDPVTDSRLRPYQGTPLPVAPPSNGRPIPPFEPLEDVRSAAPPTPFPYISPYASQASSPTIPPAQTASPVFPWENVTGPASGPVHSQEPAASTPPQPAQPQPSASAVSNFFGDPNDPNAPKSGLQRAINAVRSTLPLVQKLLPLLDGNFVTAITSLVAPQTGHHPPPPPVPVDFEPVERGLAEVRNSHRELRTQVQEQLTSLKRVEDQLERVREATDRNTLEQQELVEDLRTVGSRVSTFAIIGLVLLAASLGLNVYFLIQLQHILR